MYRCELGSPGKKLRISRDESSVLKEQTCNTKSSSSSPINTRNREKSLLGDSPVESFKAIESPTTRRSSTRLQSAGSTGKSTGKVKGTAPSNKTCPKTPRQTASSTRKPLKATKSISKSTTKSITNKVVDNRNLFGEARRLLHPSAVPETLSCRSNEFCQILHFIKDALLEGVGGCMYIAGVPGTGKTATVLKVIRYLSTNASKLCDQELPPFKFIEVNGLKLTDPQQFYTSVYFVRYTLFFYHFLIIEISSLIKTILIKITFFFVFCSN